MKLKLEFQKNIVGILLIKLDGLELKTTYQKALIDLAQKENNLAIIYRNAKTNIEEPANFKKDFL